MAPGEICPKSNTPGKAAAQAPMSHRVYFVALTRWANKDAWLQGRSLALSCPALNSDEGASNCCRRANTLLYRSHELNHTLYRSLALWLPYSHFDT